MKLLRALPRIGPLLLAALFLRAVVPTGWMPVADDGRLGWVLCGEPALLQAGDHSAPPISAGTSEHGDHANTSDHGKEHRQDPCPFGALAAASTLSGGADLVQGMHFEDRVFPTLAAVPARHQRRPAHAYARGPPTFG
ncbi:hypothetical protein [Erythrobacter sp. SD-21]|uniref:hypothetical protein n=1 Tax=Erythrobacter sp. SD-21 TaxID=161528 RepID=UPI000153EE80|nr:hypothetical protein [Erythrobacter sp. SD-21]EDL48906.1 hypothetical protein ED21_24286 [Erythrobacter sp. SD-21]